MGTLFIDTHSKKIIISVLENDQEIKTKIVDEKLDHSRLCMPTLIETIKEAKKTIQDITDIIVVNGPGSFTGERLGVTIAKTLAYTLNVPIRTITSLETTLASITYPQNIILALEEKNGYFIAEFDQKKNIVQEYTYLKQSEFKEFTDTHDVTICTEYDISSAVRYAHQKQPTIPHQVNPFYVKKIEVEK